MPQQPLIQLSLALEGSDQDELLDLTASLRQELAETDVESVETVRGAPAPDSSKGIEPATAQLLVTLATGLVPSVIVLIQNFLLRQKDQTLRIKVKDVEMELPRNASPEEIQQLVETIEKVAKTVS